MTVFQNMKKGLIPARLTVADVYALQDIGLIDDRDRFELIEGEIVPMAAAKAGHHERMKSQLNRALTLATTRETWLFVEPSVTLNADTFVEPDIALWPQGVEWEDVRGPDVLLVVEVAVSSLGYDLRVKAKLYARHGVRDYWVVDAVRKTIRAHRAPGPDGYSEVEEYEAHDAVQALLLAGVTIRLDRLD
jgi:Uma2 family endonuclease